MNLGWTLASLVRYLLGDVFGSLYETINFSLKVSQLDHPSMAFINMYYMTYTITILIFKIRQFLLIQINQMYWFIGCILAHHFVTKRDLILFINWWLMAETNRKNEISRTLSYRLHFQMMRYNSFCDPTVYYSLLC